MSPTNHPIMNSDAYETPPTPRNTMNDSATATTPKPEIVPTTSAGVEMCPVLGPHLLLGTAGNILAADAEDADANADLEESGGGYVQEEVGYVDLGGEGWVLGDPYLGADGWMYDLDEEGEYVAVFPQPIFVRQGLEAIVEQSEPDDPVFNLCISPATPRIMHGPTSSYPGSLGAVSSSANADSPSVHNADLLCAVSSSADDADNRSVDNAGPSTINITTIPAIPTTSVSDTKLVATGDVSIAAIMAAERLRASVSSSGSIPSTRSSVAAATRLSTAISSTERLSTDGPRTQRPSMVSSFSSLSTGSSDTTSGIFSARLLFYPQANPFSVAVYSQLRCAQTQLRTAIKNHPESLPRMLALLQRNIELVEPMHGQHLPALVNRPLIFVHEECDICRLWHPFHLGRMLTLCAVIHAGTVESIGLVEEMFEEIVLLVAGGRWLDEWGPGSEEKDRLEREEGGSGSDEESVYEECEEGVQGVEGVEEAGAAAVVGNAKTPKELCAAIAARLEREGVLKPMPVAETRRSGRKESKKERKGRKERERMAVEAHVENVEDRCKLQ